MNEGSPLNLVSVVFYGAVPEIKKKAAPENRNSFTLLTQLFEERDFLKIFQL